MKMQRKDYSLTHPKNFHKENFDLIVLNDIQSNIYKETLSYKFTKDFF